MPPRARTPTHTLPKSFQNFTQAGADAAAPSASTDNGDAPAAPPAPLAPCPEVDLFAYLVTVVFLLDAGKAAEVREK